MGAELLRLTAAGRDFASGLFWSRQRTVALEALDLELRPRETVGLLGQSGSGKTTALRIAGFLLRPTRGEVSVGGRDPWRAGGRERRRLRRDVQYVFQDGSDAFDPRQAAAGIVEEPLRNFGVPATDRRERVAEGFAAVGLTADLRDRHPHQLSGGQRQRLGIARALVLEPGTLLLDEPVSALDVSLAAQVLNLLRDLQEQRGLGYLLVSHELPVVQHLADRVLVLYAGLVVEEGGAKILSAPAHPYTQALRAAALTVDPGAGLPPIAGVAPPAQRGCAFAPSCPAVHDRCREARPALARQPDGRRVRCFLFSDQIDNDADRLSEELP